MIGPSITIPISKIGSKDFGTVSLISNPHPHIPHQAFLGWARKCFDVRDRPLPVSHMVRFIKCCPSAFRLWGVCWLNMFALDLTVQFHHNTLILSLYLFLSAGLERTLWSGAHPKTCVPHKPQIQIHVITSLLTKKGLVKTPPGLHNYPLPEDLRTIVTMPLITYAAPEPRCEFKPNPYRLTRDFTR